MNTDSNNMNTHSNVDSNTNVNMDSNVKKTIKHIVISGGAQTGFQALGAMNVLLEKGVVNFDNIETIYGTSAGAIMAVLFALRLESHILNDYMIKRPWHKVFPLQLQQILESFSKRGFFGLEFFEKMYKPLFEVKNISLNITFQEFYEFCNIDIHFFCFEMNSFETIDMSYKTHPNLRLLEAVQRSSALPIIFCPVFDDANNKCYIDGGLTSNYPLNKCISSGLPSDEILGFRNRYKEDTKLHFDSNSNLFNFMLSFIFRLVYSFSTHDKQMTIKNEVLYDADALNVEVMMEALTSSEARQKLFQSGEEAAKSYIESLSLL